MSPTKKFRAALMAAVVGAAMVPQGAMAAACMTADESAAERVRRLQTTLMIGALQCRNFKHLDVAGIYNKVVREYGPVISAHNQILTRYFERAHGRGYKRAMDSHVTLMANTISRAAQQSVTEFCPAVAKIGNEMLRPSPPDIVAHAQWVKLVEVAGPKACGANRPITARAGNE